MMSSIKTVHDSSQFIQDVSTTSNTLAPTPTTLQNSNRKKQTPFTLNNFRTKHLLHQTPFRRGTFYTRHLLHQKTFTPNIKHLLHQAHFTPHNFCPPDIFYRPNTAFSPDFQQTPDFESKASESRSANRQYASIHFRKKRVVRGFCQETHVLHDTIRTPVPSPDCIPNALPNGNHTLVHKRPFQNLHFTTVLSVRPPRNAKKVALIPTCLNVRRARHAEMAARPPPNFAFRQQFWVSNEQEIGREGSQIHKVRWLRPGK